MIHSAAAQLVSPDSIKSATPPPIRDDNVTVIAPRDRVVAPCSSVVGLMREACVDQGDVWMGMVSSEPETASLFHDHGERTTYILPIAGEGHVELEDGTIIPMKPDGSVYVIPPRLRHREVNPGGCKMQAFLVRIGPKSAGRTE